MRSLILILAFLTSPVWAASPMGYETQFILFNQTKTQDPAVLISKIIEMSVGPVSCTTYFKLLSEDRAHYDYSEVTDSMFPGVPMGPQTENTLQISNGDVECAGKGGTTYPASRFQECTYRELDGKIMIKAESKFDQYIAICQSMHQF